MDENKKIVVTEDAWKCLNALTEAIESLPEGDFKEKGKAALNYLSALFAGETLPTIVCPSGKLIIGSD